MSVRVVSFHSSSLAWLASNDNKFDFTVDSQDSKNLQRSCKITKGLCDCKAMK
jgi:hypothetical protein